MKPGVPVQADTVIMVMTSPELETDLVTAEYAMKGAEADYKNLEVTLHKNQLDLKSAVQQTKADYDTAKLEADRDAALTKEKLLAETDSKISRVKAEQLAEKYKIDEERLENDAAAQTAQLEAQKVKVDNLKSQFRTQEEPGGQA